ncbi:hypothetical protein EDB19DRAFT_136887 [Suillus lakei]|nr:hypothetical protein EDB19DRAFT_136887 [Suillus lakei]
MDRNRKSKKNTTCIRGRTMQLRDFLQYRKMQTSTTSPSAAMHSTYNDCVASQSNNINQTAIDTYTIDCGRHGCPAVFVYKVGTDWLTVSRVINGHYPVCTGGSYGLDPLYLHCHTHGAPNKPSPRQLAPVSSCANDSNRDDFIIAGSSERRKKEDERKEELENDEYTEVVRPTSVRCRECQKIIRLNKRSRYYPGLWVKHRGKCPGILKLEDDELTRRRDSYSPWNPGRRPQATSPLDAGGGYEEEEDSEEEDVVPFSTSNVRRFYDNCGQGEQGNGRTGTPRRRENLQRHCCGCVSKAKLHRMFINPLLCALTSPERLLRPFVDEMSWLSLKIQSFF